MASNFAPRFRLSLRLMILALLAAVFLSASFVAQAAVGTTLTVTSTSDTSAIDSACTLREAIQSANTNTAVDNCVTVPSGVTNGTAITSPYTIDFNISGSGPFTILLTGAGGEDNNASGDLDVKTSMTIQNTSGKSITVESNASAMTQASTATDRVFDITTGTVSISNLTIANGKPSTTGGGAFLVESAATLLSLNQVTVSGNYGANGGAIYAQSSAGAAVTITNSTINNNDAGSGGAIYFNSTGTPGTATLTIKNSTVAFNGTASAGNGGAIFKQAGSGVFTNATFFGNGRSGVNGSGLYNQSGSVAMNNTIAFTSGVTATSGTTAQCYIASGTTGGGNNFGGGCPSDITGFTTSDIASSLADNGGPTKTLKLADASLAKDAGSDSAATGLTTDQRGTGFARISGAHVDVGAYEIQAPPAVTNVTSTKTDGAYKAGTTIDITVTFDQSVTVTGTPQLTLETGATDRTVDYASGSGSATLTFTYTVQAGDTSSDLDYTATSALSANGGSIKNGSTDATLTLPSPGATGSLGANKALVIDTTAPTTTISTALSGTITDNTPTISFSGDDSGSGVDHYQCSVDSSADGDFSTCASPYTTSTLNDGQHTIYVRAVDTAGNVDATPDSRTFTVDATGPSVTSVTSSTSDGAYKASSVISIQVVFNDTVTVTGTPQLTLETGATDETVDYASGSGTDTLTFIYTVQAGDTSSDLDYTSTSALALNGGTIEDAVGNDATLTLPAPGATNSLGDNKALVIDTTEPDTSIDSGPTGPTGDNTPTFTFSGTDTGGSGVDHIECRVDSDSFVTCTSPYITSTLGDGPHTFEAQAVDEAGNIDSTAASQGFSVDTGLPTADLTSAPDVTSAGGTSYSFTVTYTDDGGIAVSTLDSNDVRVTGPNSFDTLATFVTVDTNSDGTPRTATYSFTPPGGSWDAADSGTYTIAMESGQVEDTSGNAVADGSLGTFDVTLAPEINVTDGSNSIADGGSYTFGATEVGTPVQPTFTIQNTGNDTLNVSNLSLPTGFSLVGTFPSSVAASSSETFAVQCDALSSGSYTGTLSFDDNDSDENPYNFTITCAVGVPEITVLRKSTELTSGDTVSFHPGDTLTFTVRNDGSGDLELTSPVDVDGDFFSLEDDLGSTTLASGESTTFAITCDDQVDRKQTGHASLSSNDSDENPFTLDLSCAPPEKHEDKSDATSTPGPSVETFLCANLESLSGGSVKVGVGKAILNGATGDIYCNLLAQNGVLKDNGAGIGDPNVLGMGVIQAVDVYGLLPGGYATDTFTGPVQVCLRGTGGVLFMSYNPATQQREVNWLPAVQQGDYTCVDISSAGIVVLVSGGTPAPAAPATPTQPASNAVTNCSVTTLYAARLRAEPNTSSEVLATVPFNLTLQATEAVDGWLRVVYGDQQGWISADLLTKSGTCG